MLDFIERMRQRPGPVRQRFVFLVAASVTGVIFLIWLSVAGTRFVNVIGPDSDARRAADSTFDEIDAVVKDAFEKSRAEYEQFQQELQNVTDITSTSSPSATTTDLF